MSYFVLIVAALLGLLFAPTEGNEGLLVETVVKSNSCDKFAENGDFLRVHYVGRFDGAAGEVFDASRHVVEEEDDAHDDDYDEAARKEEEEDGNTYNFVLGAGQVIQGYEEGVPGMCEGETRTLTVPPSMAYGEEGYPGVIPGGATLHFTVELVEIVKMAERPREEM